MLQQDTVHLYLDRDTTGQNYIQKALALGDHFKDESPLYQEHKDLNDWIRHIGKSQKQGFHQKYQIFFLSAPYILKTSKNENHAKQRHQDNPIF